MHANAVAEFGKRIRMPQPDAMEFGSNPQKLGERSSASQASLFVYTHVG
jgi:hypothetical protein